ncbi:SIR2 family protein [Acinetobacter baumannii]
MMIEIDETILDTIIEAKKNNKLAFFIGAGFSKNSETELKRIPLWGDLINDLKKSLNIENENDFLKIAQLYYLKYGEYQYYNKLKKYFELNLEPSRVHKKLFSLLPNLIVTTNWDCLLEHTAIEEGLTYDVIVSDVDLVKSSYFHKIVKMHGDFQHHNIVFKEDDYLKYYNDFPLIENYIKSILSTHVVVFIGYSYSDVDLKLITKWIETKSKVTPPKYLFSSRYNEAEASYLKNHGIQFLNPKSNPEYRVSDILIDFFDIISEKNEFLRYKKILEKEFLDFNEELLLVKILYQKIKILDELESIFPMQIKELFSNSTIEFHVGCYAFYLISDGILTTDHDEIVRKYYKFINKIIEKNKGVDNEITIIIKKIFNIFKKANILFLKFTSKNENREYFDIKEYLGEKNEDNQNLYLNFSSKGESNDLMFLENYKELEKSSLLKIASNIKERNYISLAINSFNNEIAQLMLKFDFKEDLNKIDGKDDSGSKSEIKVFKDYFDFYGLTNKKEYNFINSFLNFNILDNIYFSTNERMKKNIARLETIKNGGLSIDSNQTEEELLVESYLNFMYKNNIAMESYSSVNDFFNNHIDYKINLIEINYKKEDKKENIFAMRQFSNQPVLEINYVDLFILLNFSENKTVVKLLRLLVDILSNDETKKIKVFFDKDIDLKSYFVKCFENLLLKKSSSNVEKVLSKLILISSVCDWKSGEFLLEKFKEIFVSYQSFQIFETINSFVAFNSKIFKSKDIDFSPYIDLIINLILENKINGFGYGAIQRGGLSNVFNYMSWRKDYSNVELINEFIYFLNSPYNENKDFYSIKYFLIYFIYLMRMSRNILENMLVVILMVI